MRVMVSKGGKQAGFICASATLEVTQFPRHAFREYGGALARWTRPHLHAVHPAHPQPPYNNELKLAVPPQIRKFIKPTASYWEAKRPIPSNVQLLNATMWWGKDIAQNVFGQLLWRGFADCMITLLRPKPSMIPGDCPQERNQSSRQIATLFLANCALWL